MRALPLPFFFTRYLDGANLLTLGNVLIGLLGISCAVAGRIAACAYLLFAATLVDYADGYLARRYFAADNDRRAFGKQLDTLADLTNFGIVPALALIVLGAAAPTHVAAGSLLVLTAVLRLSHFMLTSEAGSGGYTGLPTTYAGFLLANVLLLYLSGHVGTTTLLATPMSLAVLQVANFRLRKLGAATNIAGMSALFALNLLFCSGAL